jgi:hypothetical protein
MLKVVNYTTERVSGEDPSQGKGRSGNFSIAKKSWTMILQEQFVLGCLKVLANRDKQNALITAQRALHQLDNKKAIERHTELASD